MARAEKKTPHLSAVTTTATNEGDTKATPARASEEVALPRRRTFTAEFKEQVLREADECAEIGDVGALLRRHGLYSSHLTLWRRQRDEGTLAGLTPRKRGRKAKEPNPLAAEVARLQAELKKATARAERAERLIDLQKKVAELLGDPLPPPPTELMAPTEPTNKRRR